MIHLFKKKHDLAKKKTNVIAVGGGKGGIGKSFITSNLSLLIAKENKKTLLIDLDFGGANAHTYLGVKNTNVSAKNFLCNETKSLEDVIIPTQFRNLSMITGSSEWSDESILNHENMNRLFTSARNLGYDTVVYDLGAGTNPETVNAFLEADIQIAVSTPEPISIENTYQFLKRCFYNSLKKSSDKHGFNQRLNKILKNRSQLEIKTPLQLLNYIERRHAKIGAQIVKDVLLNHPYVLINQCRSPRDHNVGKSLAQISRRYFGQEIKALGSLNHENRVWQSVRSMKPLALEYPECLVLHELENTYERLKNIENKTTYNYPKAA